MAVKSIQRIRRSFAPLVTACSVELLTPASSPAQVFNAVSGEYDPDRGLTPMVLQPIVEASAADDSWPEGRANANLAAYSWYVNGQEIGTLAQWRNLYTIDDSQGDSRGAITILRNLAPGESVELQFRGQIYDSRIGANVPIESEPITLSCTAKSEDSYSLSIMGTHFDYNPFDDRLLEYDYKVAEGIIAASETERQRCIDDKCYLRTIGYSLTRGGRPADTSGVRMWLYRNNGWLRGYESVSSITAADVGKTMAESMNFTFDSITFDLRLVQKGVFSNYLLVAYDLNGNELARATFGFVKRSPAYRIEPVMVANFPSDATKISNSAVVISGGKRIKYPSAVLGLTWYTDTANQKGVVWQRGDRMEADLQKAGVGNTASTSWIDVYVEADERESSYILTNSANVPFMDDKGNTYIND